MFFIVIQSVLIHCLYIYIRPGVRVRAYENGYFHHQEDRRL